MKTMRFLMGLATLAAVCATRGDAPDLKAVQQPMSALHPLAKFSIAGSPDWLAIDDSVWISNKPKNNLTRIDPKTNRVLATVSTGKGPCAGLALGFGSVWVPNCGDRTISRFDARTAKSLATISVGIADTEGTIAAGEGSVWMPSDASGVLARIDPATNKVVARIPVPAGSFVAVVNPCHSISTPGLAGRSPAAVPRSRRSHINNNDAIDSSA